MHSISEEGTNVPAFLTKLWKLVEDPATNGLITWSSEGSSFLIRNQAQFSRELLPLYYKHNNLASFIRQLNMYGFRKISSVDSGGLKLDRDEMEFAHKYFLRGHSCLLSNIKRKIPTGAVHSSHSMSNSSNGNVKPELVSRVLQDVRQMKGRQETLDSRFNAMKRENEALWRELALLRQKHMKQQQIVNKVIQFLVTLVQPNRRLAIKKTYPLMLNDSPNVLPNRRGATQPKAAKLNLISDVMTNEELSPKGPVIHELDNNADYIFPDDDYEDLGGVDFGCEKLAATEKAKVGVAASVSDDKLKFGVGYSQCAPISPEIGAEAGDVPIDLAKQEELDTHIDAMQSEIEHLKEMLLKGNVSSPGLGGNPGNDSDLLAAVGGLEGFCLDASALLGVCPASLGHLLDPAVIEGGGHGMSKLFSSEDPLPIGMNLLPGSSEGSSDKTKENPDFSVSGNEIAAYNPTLLDLVEDNDDSQMINWYDEESCLSKETSSSDAVAVTSSSVSRDKGSVSGTMVGITGKGAGKVNVTSINSPKNTHPSRRKTK